MFIYVVVRHNHLFRLASLYGNQSSKAYVLNENTPSSVVTSIAACFVSRISSWNL